MKEPIRTTPVPAEATIVTPADKTWPLIDGVFRAGTAIPIPWGREWLWIKRTRVDQGPAYKLWTSRRPAPAQSAKSRPQSP